MNLAIAACSRVYPDLILEFGGHRGLYLPHIASISPAVRTLRTAGPGGYRAACSDPLLPKLRGEHRYGVHISNIKPHPGVLGAVVVSWLSGCIHSYDTLCCRQS